MRRTIATVVSVAALLIVAALLNRVSSAQGTTDQRDVRIEKGFDIAPVPLLFEARNRELVGLGSYLVNAVGACNDCHTCPSYASGHNPFFGQPTMLNVDGYLAGGVPFGPFVARNITPDPEEDGRPAGLTLDQFVLVMRTGIDLDNLHPPIKLLQVMPWPVFGNMTDNDLHAIYEYLSAIPPRKTPPQGSCSGAGQ
jgi:hypothetical protein